MKCQLFAATILVLACKLANAATPTVTAISTIDRALQSKNPDTRREAVRALSMLGSNPPYQGRLESMLNDKDVPVRLAVVASLSDAG